MSTISTAQRRHSDYYLKKLHDLDSQYRKGGDEASQALESFTREWDQCKLGQAYAAQWLGRQDWGADFSIGYAIAGTLLLSLQFPPYQRIEWLASGLRAAKLKQDLSLEVEMWGQLGSANDALGNWKISVRLYRESLKKSRLLKDRETEGRTFGSLGLVYMMLSNHDEARINLEKALAIAREVGDRQGEGRHLGSLGLISQGSKSIDYFEQALQIARATGDREGEISHLGCLGTAWLQSHQLPTDTPDRYLHPNILMRNQRPDGSLPENLRLRSFFENPLQNAGKYFKEAALIAREIGDVRAEARHLGNLGEVRSKEGKTQEALDCYREALTISERIGDLQNQVKQLENMKSAYISLHDKDEVQRIEARLKEVANQVTPVVTENILEKFGTNVIDPFGEDYWRASREEDIDRYWSDYYRTHLS